MPSLVEYDLIFLKKSWEWLKNPELKALTLTPDFTQQDQEIFYNSLPQRMDYWIQGIKEDAQPIGAMGLKNITKLEAEYWGYIGEKDYWARGIGSYMLEEALKKAKELGLQKIYLNVSAENERAKKLYEKMGFHKTTDAAVEKYELIL